MARKQARLKVVITPAARRDFRQIWMWNAKDENPDRADTYQSFLDTQVAKLATDYRFGKVVTSAPEFRYALARKAKHGHYIVYQVHEEFVEILRLFHTRQDWENRLREET